MFRPDPWVLGSSVQWWLGVGASLAPWCCVANGARLDHSFFSDQRTHHRFLSTSVISASSANEVTISDRIHHHRIIPCRHSTFADQQLGVACLQVDRRHSVIQSSPPDLTIKQMCLDEEIPLNPRSLSSTFTQHTQLKFWRSLSSASVAGCVLSRASSEGHSKELCSETKNVMVRQRQPRGSRALGPRDLVRMELDYNERVS